MRVYWTTLQVLAEPFTSRYSFQAGGIGTSTSFGGRSFIDCFVERVERECDWCASLRAGAASREPIFASHCFFFLFIYFLAFSINVNVFLSKWFTLQKKRKFSIFFRAWNSAQAVAVVCWRSVYIQIWMKFLSFPRKILYQHVDYVKLTNIQIYTGKRSSEANFR